MYESHNVVISALETERNELLQELNANIPIKNELSSQGLVTLSNGDIIVKWSELYEYRNAQPLLIPIFANYDVNIFKDEVVPLVIEFKRKPLPENQAEHDQLDLDLDDVEFFEKYNKKMICSSVRQRKVIIDIINVATTNDVIDIRQTLGKGIRIQAFSKNTDTWFRNTLTQTQHYHYPISRKESEQIIKLVNWLTEF